MHICIFQTGEPLHIDEGQYRPMRCMLLADKLLAEGYSITIISSSFFHQRKSFRSKSFKTIKIQDRLTIHLIPSLGYKKHISLKRIIDHLFLALNLHLFLRKQRSFKPDRIFIGFPPILSSFIISRWALKSNIPYIVDVKDKWPEIFIEPFPNILKPLAVFLTKPFFMITIYVFKKASKITTISKGYVSWIKKLLKLKKSSIFISPLIRKPINLREEDKNLNKILFINKGINLNKDQYFCFVGSYSKSFDFNFIGKLSKRIINKYPNIKIILCGTGDQYEILIKKFKDYPNLFVFGEINLYEAKLLIKKSLATLAPYKNNPNFNDHIPNKIIESLENGIPFITTIDGKLKDLIKKENNGIYIKNKKNIDITKIEKLINDKMFRANLKLNARRSYKKLFNFDETYSNIINNLKNL